jgi:hypothetical protein
MRDEEVNAGGAKKAGDFFGKGPSKGYLDGPCFCLFRPG